MENTEKMYAIVVTNSPKFDALVLGKTEERAKSLWLSHYNLESIPPGIDCKWD